MPHRSFLNLALKILITVLFLLGIKENVTGQESKSENAAAKEVPVALCHFVSSTPSYTVRQEVKALAELIQSQLMDVGAVSWVDRASIDSAISELELSSWNQRGSAKALRIGQITSAEMAIIGRYVADDKRIDLEVVDLARADVLNSISVDLSKFPRLVRDASVTMVAGEIRKLLSTALKTRHQWSQRTHVAILNFRNEQISSRLDFLATDLHAAVASENQKQDSIRFLQLPRSADAIEEAELLSSGIAVLDAASRKPFADYYVWGSYREVDSSGVVFSDVMVEVDANVWTGQSAPHTFQVRGPVKDLPDLVADFVSQVRSKTTPREAGVFDGTIQNEIAGELLSDSKELLKLGNYGTEVGHQVRLSRQRLKLLSMAAFFDPQDPVIGRELFLESQREFNSYQKGKERFYVSLGQLELWQSYLDKFGPELGSFYHHFDPSLRHAVRRLESSYPALLGSLLVATGDDPEDRMLPPDDVPPEVLAAMNRRFADDYLRHLQGTPDAFSERNVVGTWSPFARCFPTTVNGVSDDVQRGRLLELLFSYAPEKHDLQFLAPDFGGYERRNDLQRATAAFAAINRPELLEEFQHKLKLGNPDWNLPHDQRAKKDDGTTSNRDAVTKKKRKPRRVNPPLAPLFNATIVPAPSPKSLGVPNRICSIFPIENSLWITLGVHRYGNCRLMKMDQTTGEITLVPTGDGGDEFSASVYFDKQIWIARDGKGIDRFDVAQKKVVGDRITVKDGLPTDQIVCMVADPDQKTLFVGGGFGRQGVLGRFDRVAGEWSQIELPQKSMHRLKKLKTERRATKVKFMAVDDNFVALMGEDERLLVWEKSTRIWTDATPVILKHEPRMRGAQPGRYDIKAMEFAGGMLWIGGRHKGMVGFNPTTKQVEFSLMTRFEISALHAQDDFLWIAGSGSRVIRFNHKLRTFDHRIKYSRRWPGPPDTVFATADKVWWGGYEKNLLLSADLKTLKALAPSPATDKPQKP